MQMVSGGWVAKLVADISRLGIPDYLKTHGTMSAAEIVSKCGLDAKPEFLERALRACASLGVFSEDADGRFGPTDLSDVLTLDSPVSVKRFAEVICDSWFWKTWVGLADAIRTGEPQCEAQIGAKFWDFLNANPKALEDFGEAMKSNSVNSMRGVLAHCDFTGIGKMVDVGGGFGHLAIALVEKYPHLQAAVLDQPDLIPIARKNGPTDPAVTSRLEYIGGNMFESVPQADAYVMKHIIHDWEDERCIQLLKNCHHSMHHDGRVFCIDSVIPPMGDAGCVTAKLLDLVMMTFITGKERTLQQWESLYSAAGFRIVNVTPLEDNMGTSIIEGAKR
jgi:hypothetical protein